MNMHVERHAGLKVERAAVGCRAAAQREALQHERAAAAQLGEAPHRARVEDRHARAGAREGDRFAAARHLARPRVRAGAKHDP